MGELFYLKVGDTNPSIEAALQGNTGDSISLDGANVQFRLRQPRGGELLVEKPAEVVDKVNGLVRYAWDDEDTNESGRYRGEFQVEYKTGRIETFPNSGFYNVVITQ